MIPEEFGLNEMQSSTYSPISFFRANSEQFGSPQREIRKKKTSIDIIREEIAESKFDFSDENIIFSK